MNNKTQSIRGMNDILPEESADWTFLENTFAKLLESYGYNEIRTPVVESTGLFERSIGEVTDIVEKEMFTFNDRNGDSLSLRPEGTAGVVRAVIEKGLLQTRLKLWYQGQMFRHERPQKGRYRQFHQLGCEVFGIAGAEIDAEVIAITARLWKLLEINNVQLQINSLGSNSARGNYHKALIKYLSAHKDQLDSNSLRRLDSNPLRILDSKNPKIQDILVKAPKINEYLDEDSREHFATLCGFLDAMSIDYTINPRLVRGLDYYNKTVFEWVTEDLGAQGTICAGGRYDGLVAQIGGKDTPAFGFALGAERLLALLELRQKPRIYNALDIYMVLQGDRALEEGLMLAEDLHDKNPQLKIMLNYGGGSFKSQFKRADKSNARYALILGEDEINTQKVTIKNLKEKTPQETIELKYLGHWLSKNI